MKVLLFFVLFGLPIMAETPGSASSNSKDGPPSNSHGAQVKANGKSEHEVINGKDSTLSERNKQETLEKLINQFSDSLVKLGKQKKDGSWELTDKEVAPIKEKFGLALGIKPENLEIETKSDESGSAFFGQSLVFADKTPQILTRQDWQRKDNFTIVDRDGRSKTITNPKLMAIFLNPKGNRNS